MNFLDTILGNNTKHEGRFVKIGKYNEVTEVKGLYKDYADYLKKSGYYGKFQIIDERNNYVKVQDIRKTESNYIIDLSPPDKIKISVKGMRHSEQSSDAYTIGLFVKDKNNEEIADDTEIRIEKINKYGKHIESARIPYSVIKMINSKMSYKFDLGIEINNQEHLQIQILKSRFDIPSENIKFKLMTDTWSEKNMLSLIEELKHDGF